MIYYDSHKWRTLIRIRGSVLPKAMLWAMPSAILAGAIKYLEQQEYFDLSNLAVLTQGDIYSGFTYVLGFSLVFRTSQSYLRYWTAATSVHEMSSEWSDSCASLIAFSTASKASHREIERFRHTVVRLFSLLHAMALSEIATVGEDFPLLDIQGLTKSQLSVLTSERAQGRKVQIVLSWIKAYITQMADRGFLNVPAPILTRVFQELGAGLVNFHKSQQIVIWPFPFPYTQLNLLLIHVYIMITPMVVSTWRTWPWMCFIFTFISVTCMVGLDMIASELENPFGDDPNDLPVLEMQSDMNKFLIMQLNPAIHHPPELEPEAVMNYNQLANEGSDRRTRMGLLQRLTGRNNSNSFVHRLSVVSASSAVSGRSGTSLKSLLMKGSSERSRSKRRDRWRSQRLWLGEEPEEGELNRMRHWLQTLPKGVAAASVRGRTLTPAMEVSQESDDWEGQSSLWRSESQRSPSPTSPNCTPTGNNSRPQLKQSTSRISAKSGVSRFSAGVMSAPSSGSFSYHEGKSFHDLPDSLRESKSFHDMPEPQKTRSFTSSIAGTGSGLPPGSVGKSLLEKTSGVQGECGELLKELTRHLCAQLEAQRRELLAIETVLARWGLPISSASPSMAAQTPPRIYASGESGGDGEGEHVGSSKDEGEPSAGESTLAAALSDWESDVEQRATMPVPMPKPLLLTRLGASGEVAVALKSNTQTL